MNCEQCNTRMTRTAVGLMCLQCGQIEHAPAAPEKPSAVRIERISTDDTANGGAIDGLQRSSSHKSLIKPRIDRAGSQTQPANAMTSRQLRAVHHGPKPEHRPAKYAAGGAVLIFGLVALSWISLHAGQPSAAKTSSTAQASLAATTVPKPKQSLVEISPQSLARDSTRKQDLTQIATALNVYYRQLGSYPVGQDIGALLSLQTTSPPYLEQIPVDPLSSEATKSSAGNFGYQYQSDGAHFKLQARLENSHDPQAQNGFFVISN